MGLSDALGFMNEPIPSFYFEVVISDLPDVGGGDFLSSMLQKGMEMVTSAILGDEASNSASFESVSGLKLSFATTPISEGGWSTPRPSFDKVENGEVELKRYLRPKHLGIGSFSLDPFTDWCQDTMETVKKWDKQVKKKNITILIYHPALKSPLPSGIGPSSVPVAGFALLEAFPTEWGISDLTSTNDSDPIKETIKLKFTEIKRLKIPFPF